MSAEALEAAYSGVTALVGKMDDQQLLLPTGCRGWTIADLIVHMTGDAQGALVAFATPTSAPADVNSVIYWEKFAGVVDSTADEERARRSLTDADRFRPSAAEAGRVHPSTAEMERSHRSAAEAERVHSSTADAELLHRSATEMERSHPGAAETEQMRRGMTDAERARRSTAEAEPVRLSAAEAEPTRLRTTDAERVRRSATAFERPSGVLWAWLETAPAAVRAARAFDPGCRLATQGRVFALHDFLCVLITEAVIHHFDLIAYLPEAAEPDPAAAAIARGTLDGLAGGSGLPAQWSTREALFKGTGRATLTDADRALLGDRSKSFPLLA